jgi:hypothetical protein
VRRALVLAAGLALLVSAPAAEADCANPITPAFVHIIPAAVGLPVELETSTGQPGCDAPGDVITSTIAWGDGSSSPARVVADGASWHISGSHSYGRAGSYPVVVSSTNTRTGITTTDGHNQVEVVDTGTRTMRQRLRWRTGVRFTGSVAQTTVTQAAPVLQRYSARIEWGDGTVSIGTVTIRGAMLSVTGRHTWHKPLRRGRIVVTVTDAATRGALTIRRAVRIA